MNKPLRTATRFAAVAAGAAAIAGCGSSSSPAQQSGSTTTSTALQPASLVLDFTPNAIHSGIYLALKRHYDRASGVKLNVVIPGASTDAPNLLATGKVNFAVLDIHDLAIADAKGQKLVGVMALVERPLAAVIAQKQFSSPKDLDGQTIGVTGDPSDLAVLNSIVAGAGGKPSTLKTITIGYDAVPDLADGRVSAATAFWNDEGVQLAHDKPNGFHVFRVEDYGAPAYPELVVSTTRSEIEQHPSVVRGVVHALVKGYEGVERSPAAGKAALESQVSGLSSATASKAVAEQLKAELGAFVPKGGGHVGALEPKLLNAWAKWELRFGIVKRLPDIRTMFDSSFLPR